MVRMLLFFQLQGIFHYFRPLETEILQIYLLIEQILNNNLYKSPSVSVTSYGYLSRREYPTLVTSLLGDNCIYIYGLLWAERVNVDLHSKDNSDKKYFLYRVHTVPGNPGKPWKIFEALKTPGKALEFFLLSPGKSRITSCNRDCRFSYHFKILFCARNHCLVLKRYTWSTLLLYSDYIVY